MNTKTIIFKKISKRVISLIFTMLLLSVILFCFARLAPGDPLQSFYGDAVESMTTQELDAARVRLGLDAPIYIQYARWFVNACQGDFGLSLKYKIPAIQVISPLIGNTLILGGTAYILVFILGVLLAVCCALNEDSLFDQIICKVGTAAYYIPSFWLGVVLILIFSINLNLLPSSGAYDFGKASDVSNRIRHMILPLIVMIMSHLWYYAYMIRNKLLDEIRKDYVLLAKSKGLTKVQIVLKHCLRNVAPTIVSIMAISIPHVLSGTIVTEAVFNYAGIGAMSVESAKYHDYNLLMLLVLINGLLVIFSSLVAQSINEVIDPRMKQLEVQEWKK
ncbi:ABC transporter permease [Clostridium thailandense]|uniref:ABC transporter permease n=1 Tax=Clostridium thailandense TaxID=2794346 RepID=UPI00398927DA